MIDFLDIYERAQMGPIMSEKDFEMKLFIPRLNNVVKAYGIQHDTENPVPSDDDAADNLFKAAVDFMSQVGIYCQDTNRVIQCSQDEILEAVREAPGTCFVGEGKEARVLGMRRPDSRKVPWLHVGSGIEASNEKIASNLNEACGSIPQANSISISALDQIRGLPVKAGSPTEIYAAIQAVKIGREAMRRAGRPGLPILNLTSTSSSAVGTIAATGPQFGIRPSDGWMVGAVSELKSNYEALNKVAYLLNYGANVGAESGPVLGGYCGGPEGTAVVSTAYILMGLLVYKANYHANFPVHFKYGCSTTRDVLWAVSVSCQAASRNIPMPVIWLGYVATGPNTKMYFYEATAYLLCAVASGAPSVHTPHPAKGVKTDGITPMEAKFGVEIGRAATKFNRQEANELVIQLLEKYQSQIEKPPTGSRYQDCYDVITGKPHKDYIRLYSEIKEELAGMGIPFE